MHAPELIIVGRLRRAHGIRGELVVEPITDAPAEVYTAGRRLFAGTVAGDPAPDGAALTMSQVRPMGDGRFIVGDMNRFGVVYMSTAGRGIVVGKPATL